MTKSRPNPRSRAVAVCAPGLEDVCRAELAGLGIKPKSGGPGAIEFDANARQIYLANVWLRTASRVLVRVAQFRATDFRHLQDGAGAIDWDEWIPDGMAPSFRVTCTDSKLYHTDAIAQRLHQIAGPPSLGEPEQMFVVRIHRNNVTVSADSSGDALHHRPWRTEMNAAPLRTTMAAALLDVVGWNREVSLIDPFCGAGTIVIEAALMAAGIPPGVDRGFAFVDWPNFEPGSWASVAAGITSRRRDVAVNLWGSDRDESAVKMAMANAERAGVEDLVSFDTRLVSHLRAAPGPGLIATNPPYGKRLGDGSVTGLYKRLGAVARERLPEWDLALISPDSKLTSTCDSALTIKAKFKHGGLGVRFVHRPPLGAPPSSTNKSDAVADQGEGTKT